MCLIAPVRTLIPMGLGLAFHLGQVSVIKLQLGSLINSYICNLNPTCWKQKGVRWRVPSRGHACSCDHIPLCHHPRGLTSNIKGPVRNISKPEAQNAYMYILFICFAFRTLCEELGSAVYTGTDGTGLLLSPSWQSSWLCSGFQ